MTVIQGTGSACNMESTGIDVLLLYARVSLYGGVEITPFEV